MSAQKGLVTRRKAGPGNDGKIEVVWILIVIISSHSEFAHKVLP